MKNKTYRPTKKIIGLILFTISIFSLIFFLRLLFIHSNQNTENITYIEVNPSELSSSYSPESLIKFQSIIERCEIIVNNPDQDYLQSLQLNYPHCKIIQKNNIYQFDLINYLLNLFN